MHSVASAYRSTPSPSPPEQIRTMCLLLMLSPEPRGPSASCVQTEKQRLIWAYKILFLDVLFPLGLKKVIFLDADQVIRTDIAELWNLDLKVGFEGRAWGQSRQLCQMPNIDNQCINAASEDTASDITWR